MADQTFDYLAVVTGVCLWHQNSIHHQLHPYRGNSACYSETLPWQNCFSLFSLWRGHVHEVLSSLEDGIVAPEEFCKFAHAAAVSSQGPNQFHLSLWLLISTLSLSALEPRLGANRG